MLTISRPFEWIPMRSDAIDEVETAHDDLTKWMKSFVNASIIESRNNGSFLLTRTILDREFQR